MHCFSRRHLVRWSQNQIQIWGSQNQHRPRRGRAPRKQWHRRMLAPPNLSNLQLLLIPRWYIFKVIISYVATLINSLEVSQHTAGKSQEAQGYVGITNTSCEYICQLLYYVQFILFASRQKRADFGSMYLKMTPTIKAKSVSKHSLLLEKENEYPRNSFQICDKYMIVPISLYKRKWSIIKLH